jgi:hypothetical protein
VGRLILDELETEPRQFGEKGDPFSAGRANRMVYNYSEKGTLKSIEDSLTRRLGWVFGFGRFGSTSPRAILGGWCRFWRRVMFPPSSQNPPVVPIGKR